LLDWPCGSEVKREHAHTRTHTRYIVVSCACFVCLKTEDIRQICIIEKYRCSDFLNSLCAVIYSSWCTHY